MLRKSWLRNLRRVPSRSVSSLSASRPSRARYLDLIDRAREAGVNRPTLSCGNLAHGFAASGEDKWARRGGQAHNIGMVTADKDMLSEQQP